jgi:hypothetical protein
MNTKAVRDTNVLKTEVFKLRRENKSYREISKRLKIPKSTLSGWLKNQVWSQEISAKLSQENSLISTSRLRLMANANKKRFEDIRAKYREEAEKEFNKYFRDKLFVSGLMIYAGEGDSKIANSIVRIANTDWRMIDIFLRFIQNICKVDKSKIRLALTLYPDLNDNECKLFWSDKTGVSLSRFHKTQFIKGHHPTNRLKNGVCSAIVCSREIKEKISVWIDLCYKYL